MRNKKKQRRHNLSSLHFIYCHGDQGTGLSSCLCIAPGVVPPSAANRAPTAAAVDENRQRRTRAPGRGPSKTCPPSTCSPPAARRTGASRSASGGAAGSRAPCAPAARDRARVPAAGRRSEYSNTPGEEEEEVEAKARAADAAQGGTATRSDDWCATHGREAAR